MVFRTAVQMSVRAGPKLNFGLPGLNRSSIKHYASVLPLHFATVGGALVCALYCYKLGSYQDTSFNKWKPFKDIKPDSKVPLFISSRRVDLKTRQVPENRPNVKEE